MLPFCMYGLYDVFVFLGNKNTLWGDRSVFAYILSLQYPILK
jgi:hypothetical protein